MALAFPPGMRYTSICAHELKNKAESRPDPEKTRLMGQLSAAIAEKNYWIAFEILKTALGQTSYKAHVREVLAVADKAVVPRPTRCCGNCE